MQSDVCKNCRYCAWMVGIGQGVRCKKEENQKHNELKKNNLPIIISFVPENCEYFEKI